MRFYTNHGWARFFVPRSLWKLLDSLGKIPLRPEWKLEDTK